MPYSNAAFEWIASWIDDYLQTPTCHRKLFSIFLMTHDISVRGYVCVYSIWRILPHYVYEHSIFFVWPPSFQTASENKIKELKHFRVESSANNFLFKWKKILHFTGLINVEWKLTVSLIIWIISLAGNSIDFFVNAILRFDVEGEVFFPLVLPLCVVRHIIHSTFFIRFSNVFRQQFSPKFLSSTAKFLKWRSGWISTAATAKFHSARR